VHRKNRFLAGRRSHRSTRAGGVSPPWFWKRTLAAASPICNCYCARRRPRRSVDLCTKTAAIALRIATSGLTLRRSWFDGSLLVRDDRAASRNQSAKTVAVASANPTHGGLTPAALGRMCVCASQKSFFAERRSHCSTRAGGVSPPWCGNTIVPGSQLRTQSEINGRRCKRESEPRRADARRSWSDARSSPNSAGFSPHNVRITHHGGLTFAALVGGRVCTESGGFCRRERLR
jgi:hypothetical protein